jgi:hypothetical protein
VGQEVTCAVRAGGEVGRATVLLETHELRVRRPMPMTIPLAAITEVDAEGDWLRIRHAGCEARFELGARLAARWASRIRHPPTRLQKIGVRAGQRVAVLGDPDDTFVDELEALGVHVLGRLPAAGGLDAVFLAIADRRGLARIPTARRALADAAALWIIRPKGTPAITEAETRQAGLDAGLVDVKVVSFSAAKTAEKFVIPVARRGARRR